MNQEKKVAKILEGVVREDLREYDKLLKAMKKQLPFFNGTKLLAAYLLKQELGDISNFDYSQLKPKSKKHPVGKIVFEDTKDGRVRVFINVGKNHRLNTGELIREIVKRSGIDGKQIGKIDIHATYSFFEVPEQYGELVILSFENTRFKGVPVVIEPAKRRQAKEKE